MLINYAWVIIILIYLIGKITSFVGLNPAKIGEYILASVKLVV